jgi:cobalt-zinc-cadmium efflux system membrane fusion protein
LILLDVGDRYAELRSVAHAFADFGAGVADYHADLVDARNELESAEADLESVRHRLRILGLSADEIEAVARDRDTSSLLPVRAPFSGEVTHRAAVLGEYVDPSVTLFEIADTGQMWAMLDVFEGDAPAIRSGQRAVVRVEGLRGDSFPGTVTWVSPEIDPSTRTLRARVELSSPEGRLRARMFGRAVVSVETDRPATIVPSRAIQWEGCCNVVFVKRSDTVFAPRKVRLGFEAGPFHVVESGVEPGEVVVTAGSFLLKTEILEGSIGAGCCEVGVPRQE